MEKFAVAVVNGGNEALPFAANTGGVPVRRDETVVVLDGPIDVAHQQPGVLDVSQGRISAPIISAWCALDEKKPPNNAAHKVRVKALRDDHRPAVRLADHNAHVIDGHRHLFDGVARSIAEENRVLLVKNQRGNNKR
jgi:hypothetical protein